ncbi:MAG: FecR family protein [Chitinophagaceae bacterium]|nr:FecR family protein [Chitinophagaceae bacterium]
MNTDLELIKKFLKNQCSDAEAARVAEYLAEAGDIEEHIPLNDWLTDNEKQLDTIVSERILQRIRDKYNAKKQSVVSKSLLRYAIAASIIGVAILLATKFFTSTTGKIPEQTVVSRIADTAQSWKVITNKSMHEIHTRLADGSLVTIYPNSSLQYLPAFEKNRRNLYLTGKAFFEVAKDSSRPFTIYAAGIATTALGTKFLVTEKSREVSVQLMEGSVKVWSQHHENKNNAVVLRPGDKIVVSNAQFSDYSLTRKEKTKQKNTTAKRSKTDPVMVKFVFKNNSLKEVFKQLEQKFGLIINYEAVAGIDEKMFTGVFLINDNLEFICKTICSLHGLKYNINGTTVTILPE